MWLYCVTMYMYVESSLIFRVDFCIDFINFTGSPQATSIKLPSGKWTREFSLASWMPTGWQEEEQAVAVKGIARGPKLG